MEIRACLNRQAKKFVGSLKNALYPYRDTQAYHEEIIADCFVVALEDADEIWSSFKEKASSDCNLTQWLFGYLRQRVRWRAINLHNRRVRKQKEYRDDGGETEAGVYLSPTTVCFPEQENVVFFKQMLEHCGMLAPEDRAVMHLILDRATAQEMVDELGLSHGDLLYRRARAMKSLRERQRENSVAE